jgi:hypothetical protein
MSRERRLSTVLIFGALGIGALFLAGLGLKDLPKGYDGRVEHFESIRTRIPGCSVRVRTQRGTESLLLDAYVCRALSPRLPVTKEAWSPWLRIGTERISAIPWMISAVALLAGVGLLAIAIVFRPRRAVQLAVAADRASPGR